MKLLFLTQQFDIKTDSNLALLTTACLDIGIAVAWGSVDHLGLHAGNVSTIGVEYDPPELPLTHKSQDTPLNCHEFDLIWILSLGKRRSFLDKIQLLKLLESKVRVINSTDALLHLRSKYGLTQLGQLFQHPETHASNQMETLAEIIERGGQWVLKPPAGSLGQQVFLLDKDTDNYRSILSHLMGQNQDQYLLLQAYLPSIKRGEKRVLVAGGQVVGCYLRQLVDDHRTNLSQGGKAELSTLSEKELRLAEAVGQHCLMLGAEFIGIDLLYPYVIEINVINPGGLGTLQALGADISAIDILAGILPT